MKTQLTFASILVLGFGFVAPSAQAGALTDKAIEIVRHLNATEYQLSNQQMLQISSQLDQIKLILLGGQASSQALMCVPHGQSYGQPIYGVFESGSGTFLGDAVAKPSCSAMVDNARLGLVCAPTGTSYGVPQFAVYQVRSGKKIGDAVDASSCQSLITKAKPNVICAGRGSSYGVAQFGLFDLNRENWIGDATDIRSCNELLGK